ncbi:uncharacterized protein VNE69_03100 [Vairimorpha necatrix]|uniref:Uncharacterized protein n=1 Tax=Vairimorpha necatrix TaxID=6039 RepID=A0AAX4JA55_9MICR
MQVHVGPTGNNKKNIENNTIKIAETCFKSPLERLRTQIEQWKKEDKKLSTEDLMICCSNSNYYYKGYFDKRTAVKLTINNFKISLENLVNKIKEGLRRVDIDETTKHLLNEKLMFCEHCFNYICKIYPKKLNYKFNSNQIIKICNNIIIKLIIFKNNIKIVEKYDDFKLCLVKTCIDLFTDEEKNAINVLGKKLLSLFNNLDQLNEKCMGVISNLKILRYKYGEIHNKR